MQHDAGSDEQLSGIGRRDHTETAEYRVFGPPGTGKTTHLSRQICHAAKRFGPNSVLVTSFSKAAAAELTGRELPISSDRVGTLHSHCWRALGRPRIAEVNVTQWNRENPHLRITAAKKERELDGEGCDENLTDDARNGDDWLGHLNRFRGMLVAVDGWPTGLREFAAKWTTYKKAHGLMDFCDLIDTARREIRIAPGSPDVIFADEAQDLNPMQLALVRTWGEHAEYFVIAADDDQTIYSWCGATPEAVLDPQIPEDHVIVLKQSYRVPRAVHALASGFIRQVTRRQEKIYEPRPADGRCTHLSRGGYKSPEHWILKTVMKHLEKGQTVMLLTSCAYMLQPVIAVLRAWGIPFHNPYRKSNGYWNPLRHGRGGSSADRVLSLMNPQRWTCGEVKLFAECLRPKGNLRPGAKAVLESIDDSTMLSIEWLNEVFEPDAFESLLAARGDVSQLTQWWSSRLAAEFHSAAQFPLAVARAGGLVALDESPAVIVGTIHSVKGGEADVVFLFPDLSPAGDVLYQKYGPPRDSVIRLFYVGMTRTRHTLYICQRESSMAVTI
jgi:superfamily I DNA/RNA helicase